MNVIESALNLIAPHICQVCSRAGNPVCIGCQNDIVTPLPSSCFLCNAATEELLTCFSCRKKTPIIHVWRAAEYTPLIKKLVAQYKFERKRAMAGVFANLISWRLPTFFNYPLVSYIPTATKRVRQRGYDHAKLMAKELAKTNQWPFLRLLNRQGQTRQVGATRLNRRKQLQGAYIPINHSQIKGANILLIDDISTTGSTLTEAARVLKKSGAATVDAAIIARKN